MKTHVVPSVFARKPAKQYALDPSSFCFNHLQAISYLIPARREPRVAQRHSGFLCPLLTLATDFNARWLFSDGHFMGSSDQVTSMKCPIFGDEPSTSLGCSNQFNPENRLECMMDGFKLGKRMITNGQSF